MNQEEAYKEIESKLTKVKDLLKECELISEQAQIEFDFSPAYGMGGTYYPHPDGQRVEKDSGGGDYGWYSSTRSCQGW